MWTVSRIVAMVILTGLSFMDYKIRKVPRDVLLLCMAGTVLYQAVTQNIDWMVSLGGGLIGMIFIGISKIRGQSGDSDTWNLSGSMGTSGSSCDFIFYSGDSCSGMRDLETEEESCIPILSVSDSGLSVWRMYRRTVRWNGS